MDVVDDVLDARDQGKGTILTLLDFSRAFDCISVSLLLSKLAYYGCDNSTVNWFHSYLYNRYQCVQISCDDSGEKIRSALCPVSRGLPQGSILSPLLFILYTADICNEINNCLFHLYADDLQLYLDFKPHDCQISVNKINEDLENVTEWANRNCLVLNPLKSKYLIMGTKKIISTIEILQPDIRVSGCSIEKATEARNLGLIFDGQLQFETHVLQAVKNCFYRLKLLYKIRPYVSTDIRILLCESLILSKLNYADSAYGPCLLKKTEKLVQRVQNACTRFCINIPPRSHITPFLNKADIMNMSSRRRLHLGTLMFGIILTQQPEYLFKKFKWARDTSCYNTRGSQYLLSTPRPHSTAFRGSFKYAASRIWNNLPPPIRKLETVGSFRRHYKNHLLALQKNQT